MTQFITAVIGFAAGAFAWSGDPLVTFFLAMCVVVWIAITSARVPAWVRGEKRTFVVRPD